MIALNKITWHGNDSRLGTPQRQYLLYQQNKLSASFNKTTIFSCKTIIRSQRDKKKLMKIAILEVILKILDINEIVAHFHMKTNEVRQSEKRNTKIGWPKKLWIKRGKTQESLFVTMISERHWKKGDAKKRNRYWF